MWSPVAIRRIGIESWSSGVIALPNAFANTKVVKVRMCVRTSNDRRFEVSAPVECLTCACRCLLQYSDCFWKQAD